MGTSSLGTQNEDAFAAQRKHPRHTFLEDIEIVPRSARPFRACTFEISIGGLSFATTKELEIGEIVELTPVVGTTLTAAVRRRSGALYGLEFLNVDEGTKARLARLCESLPLFRSLLDS